MSEELPAGAEYVKLGGRMLPLRDAQEAAISRVEHEAFMVDAEFDAAFEGLDATLVSRRGLAPHTSLVRLLKATVAIFNTGRLRQAERLAGLVVTLFDRLAVGSEHRDEIRGTVTPEEVNEGLLNRYLAEPDARAAVSGVIRVIGYLHPAEALAALAVESRRDRRRLLLNAIETFGEAAYAIVVDRLARPGTPNPWYVTRNLLFLISRLELPDEAHDRETIEQVGRYVVHDQPQVRSAAIAALRHIGGREVIPFLARALEPAAYPPGSIDDADLLRRHLLAVMEGLVESGNEAATTIVAELATGARGHEFDLGAALKEEAFVALAHRVGPLPRRAALAVVAGLEQIVGKRLKLVTEKLALGVDPVSCRNLSALIGDSPEPEAREILEHPVLGKLLAQHAAGR